MSKLLNSIKNKEKTRIILFYSSFLLIHCWFLWSCRYFFFCNKKLLWRYFPLLFFNKKLHSSGTSLFFCNKKWRSSGTSLFLFFLIKNSFIESTITYPIICYKKYKKIKVICYKNHEKKFPSQRTTFLYYFYFLITSRLLITIYYY